MSDQEKSIRDTMEEVYDRMTEGGDETPAESTITEEERGESADLSDVTTTSSDDYRFEETDESSIRQDTILEEPEAREDEESPRHADPVFEELAAPETSDAPDPGHWASYLQQQGVTADHAFQVLLQTEYSLRNGSPQEKRNALLGIMAEYGIDMGQGIPSAQAHAPAPIRDPAVPYLEQQFGALLNHVVNRQHAEQETNRWKARAQIAEFKSRTENGKLLHPHYDEVKQEVGALLLSGQANTLDEAYSMAVQANPKTRELISEKQRHDRRIASHERAQRARRQSSSNLRTSKAPGGPKTPKTMRETMEEVYDRMTS